MIQKTDLVMLKTRMEKLESVKSEISVFKQKVDEEMKPFALDKQNLEEEIADLKLVIGSAAIAEFEKTGIKKLLGGVGVQVKKLKTISYDASKALEWCKAKDMFVVLDKKSFEKAVDSLNIDFVTIKTDTENKATFPKVIKLEGK